jgi:putative SOS response-associated peptidase YedK
MTGQNKSSNVRAETLRDKPTFRSDFLQRRCVVIADGFYEWKATTAGKTPYRIHLKKNGPLAFRGHLGTGTGNALRNRDDRSKHHSKTHPPRMPLILLPDECGTWLANETLPKLLERLAPREYKGMEAYEVSRRVNTAKMDSRDLINRESERSGLSSLREEAV